MHAKSHMAKPYIHAENYFLQYKCPHKEGLEQFTAPTGKTTTTMVIGVNWSQDSVTHHCRLSYKYLFWAY